MHKPKHKKKEEMKEHSKMPSKMREMHMMEDKKKMAKKKMHKSK